MIKNLKLYALLVAGLAIGISSCELKDKVEDAQTTCIDTETGCGYSFETCSTGIKTWYTYRGTQYNCDGTDCDQAAQDLVDDYLADCE